MLNGPSEQAGLDKMQEMNLVHQIRPSCIQNLQSTRATLKLFRVGLLTNTMLNSLCHLFDSHALTYQLH